MDKPVRVVARACFFMSTPPSGFFDVDARVTDRWTKGEREVNTARRVHLPPMSGGKGAVAAVLVGWPVTVVVVAVALPSFARLVAGLGLVVLGPPVTVRE